MMRLGFWSTATLWTVFLQFTCCPWINANERPEANWGAWRGPMATGVAPQADPPVVWSESQNIRWKVPIVGRGHSTPIVWSDRVFLTTAVPYGERLAPKYSTAPGTHDGIPVTHRHQFTALALNRSDGKIVWQRVLRQSLPHEGGHYTASLASNSMVTDGEYVFAFFGTYGLYCLDLDGKTIWEKTFGEMKTLHGHGEACTPVVQGDTVVINWDHEGESFVAALEKHSGKEIWRVTRDEPTSWSTPIVVQHNGVAQLVVSGTKRVRSYDLRNGQVIWECGGLSSNIVASPVAAGGMIFVGSSYEKKSMFAILLEGAKGDVTDSNQVAWSRNRATPYVPSPLLYEDSLYFLTHYQGVLNRVQARTGVAQQSPIRLATLTDIYASPVAAAGRIYVTDRDGQTAVLSHAVETTIIAVNKLDDVVNASLAIVAGEIFLRGEKCLYCIANG